MLLRKMIRRLLERRSGVPASIVDPVCWTDVARRSIAGKSDYKGKTYYFCSIGCKETFDRDPEMYAGSNDKNEANPQID